LVNELLWLFYSGITVPPSITKPSEQERKDFVFQFPNDGGSRQIDFQKHLKRTVNDSRRHRWDIIS